MNWGGRASASAPPLPSPLSPLQEAAEVQPAPRAGAGAPVLDGAAPQALGGRDPPTAHSAAGAAGRSEEGGAATLHADPVRCAQGPHLQVMHGAPGAALLQHQAPRGAPSIGASSGRCAATHAVWGGGRCAPCPPPPNPAPAQGRGGGGASDDDNGEGASQGSGAALAPTGR